MSTAEPVLTYQSPVYGWKPPADVLGHNGEQLNQVLEFFQPAPPDIGKVLTAGSTLKEAKEPFPMFARLLLVIGLPVAIGFTAYALSSKSTRNGGDIIIILGLILGVASPFVAWWATRFRHTCSFVGEKGVARYTLKGYRGNTPAQEIFLFENALELRTGQTRQFVNGVYSGTDYHYKWSDETGRTVFKLSGRYHSKEGNPRQGDPYWLAAAAERAWSMFEVDRMQQQLERNGYVHFNLGGSNFVRVGPGFFEFSMKGEVARITTDEIKKLTLDQGHFHIHHKDAKWFSRKGKFDFPYAQMANARLFLFAIEKLCGYRFN
jgi:hypothetical protein